MGNITSGTTVSSNTLSFLPDSTAGHRHLMNDTSALLTWPQSVLSDPESVVSRRFLQANDSSDAAVAQWLSTMGQTHGLYVASNNSITMSNDSGSVMHSTQSSSDSTSTPMLAMHYKPPTTLEDLQYALKIFAIAMAVVCVAHAVMAGFFKLCRKTAALPMYV